MHKTKDDNNVSIIALSTTLYKSWFTICIIMNTRSREKFHSPTILICKGSKNEKYKSIEKLTWNKKAYAFFKTSW